MWQRLLLYIVLLTSTGVLAPGLLMARPLSIKEAIDIAVTEDLKTSQWQQNTQALREQAVAMDALPDPKLKLGMMNYPTDSFEKTQEPMTQNVIGIQQMFPAGNTLELRSDRSMAMASVLQAVADNSHRQLVRDVRKAWLELFYWNKAKDVVLQNRNLFAELVKITASQYATGRQKQQDVIRAELEQGMIDDRINKIQTMVEVSEARLARFIGEENVQRGLDDNLPDLPVVNPDHEWLSQHPLISKEEANIKVNEKSVSLARQEYKPSWMLDITYGQREGKNMDGSERADFLSAMIMVDLPLFTGNRQDKKLAASRLKLNSAQDSREDTRRILKEMWDRSSAKWSRLKSRYNQYKTYLFPKAKENARAALFDYQNARGSFNALVRAQILKLETGLNMLRLEVDSRQEQAELLYLAGEKNESI